MKTAIITGGSIHKTFVSKRLEQGNYDYIIAVDHGADFLCETGFCPDVMVGDFDSVKEETLSFIRKNGKTKIMQYQPEKDDTDTELAMKYAILKGATQIDIYGATGTRLDHVLGNIQLLMLGIKNEVPCYIIDETNCIRMINHRCIIKKQKQHGRYVSILPYTTKVVGVTLRGMKYPLERFTLEGGRAIGVSNEIVDDEAVIDLEEGILIVIESKDK